MDKQQIIELIFQTLQGGRFEDFYKNELDNFITGEEKVSAEQIKSKIESIFHLNQFFS